MKNIMKKLISKKNLTIDESYSAINSMLTNKVKEAEIGAFLMGLEMKGVCKDEIIGAVKSLKENVNRVDVEMTNNAIDTCGTGGDGKSTINISTGASIIAAGCGVKILKHGNRSVSSKSGSTDVLEELNINIPLDKKDVVNEFKTNGMGFLYAPYYHKALKNVTPVRKSLGFKTIFNMIGPLVNPANVKSQVIGVYDECLTELYCEVLKYFGSKNALVVHGLDGIDEITITNRSKVSELKNGLIKSYYIDPIDFGIQNRRLEDILGDTPKVNAEKIKEVFYGKKGPVREILTLNAGSYIYLSGLSKSIKEGYKMANDAIDKGIVKDKYEKMTKS